ncbi:MAG TPA: histidine kinase [Verrucomicrobiae bacterium]|nr:histidine kinase [Verrucomicrobiae bacterium]
MNAKWVALLALALAGTAGAEEAVLTNAADILALPAKEARLSRKVRVTGVVTVAEPNWHGKFFVQDASGGVFVNHTKGEAPKPGDLVEVTGVTHPGGYAPDVSRPTWKKLGTAPLPAARPITVEQLMSGAEDGQRVEVAAVVRSAQVGPTRMTLELASGGNRFRAFPPVMTNLNPQELIGAQVRIRGTAAASFNAPLRHILTMVMFVPQASDFIIDQLPGDAMAEEPLTPLNGIAQYRRRLSPDPRIRVKGVVTYQRLGEDVFLHDSTGGLQVKSSETNRFAPGEVVEAVGFPDLEHYLPVLRDATITRTSESRELVLPKEVPFVELTNGAHHAEAITLRGKLIDSSLKRIGTARARRGEMRSVLTLQNGSFLFIAEAPALAGSADLASIPIGSTLEVSGICELQVGSDGKADSIQILVPTLEGIRVLQRPSWWTPERLLMVLGGVVAALALAMTWAIMIIQKNSALKASIADRIVAQEGLQKAHDLLESRVQERTKQLKFEMTARKETEVQFKATLAERTRLAQELHDTLEQSLTGIGLQLDASTKLFERQPTRASHHLEIARNMMIQSQKELRRSIWDLRSRELEQFDLRSALLASGRQTANGANITVDVQTEGAVCPLSEVVEENLLRIGQEALTNVVKHAEARSVRMTLAFHPACVILKIKDDGKGFAAGQVIGAVEGHYGLVGMQERSKRLNGTLTIESSSTAGTCVQVEIPFLPAVREERPPSDLAELA